MFISIVCLTILWKLARRYRVQYAYLKCLSQWDTKQTRKLTRYFVLGFRWSKRAKITLETISFCQNISISIFKFSPFFYTVKVCQWNLINFSKFENALIRKKKKHLRSSHWEKKYWEKLDFLLKKCGLIKTFNMIINHFLISQAYSQPKFCFLISGRRKKYQKGKLGTANSWGWQITYLFQK